MKDEPKYELPKSGLMIIPVILVTFLSVLAIAVSPASATQVLNTKFPYREKSVTYHKWPAEWEIWKYQLMGRRAG